MKGAIIPSDALLGGHNFWAELAHIEAESIGWIPLGEGAYLHVDDDNATQVLVVGVAGDAVLLVG